MTWFPTGWTANRDFRSRRGKFARVVMVFGAAPLYFALGVAVGFITIPGKFVGAVPPVDVGPPEWIGWMATAMAVLGALLYGSGLAIAPRRGVEEPVPQSLRSRRLAGQRSRQRHRRHLVLAAIGSFGALDAGIIVTMAVSTSVPSGVRWQPIGVIVGTVVLGIIMVQRSP